MKFTRLIAIFIALLSIYSNLQARKVSSTTLKLTSVTEDTIYIHFKKAPNSINCCESLDNTLILKPKGVLEFVVELGQTLSYRASRSDNPCDINNASPIKILVAGSALKIEERYH